MVRTTPRWVASLASAALLVSATACEPSAPAPTLHVTSTWWGRDAVPGDGTCEVTVGAGDCTLHAAIDEGSALGAATLVVPPGRYDGVAWTVSGRLVVREEQPGTVQLGSPLVTVTSGASLTIDGLWSFDVPGARFVVEGDLVARRVSLVQLEGTANVTVRPGGRAVLESSLLAQFASAGSPALVNDGLVVLRHVTLWSQDSGRPPGPGLSGSGTTHAASSLLLRCAGVAPVSLGYNVASDGSCALGSTGDLEGHTPVFSADISGKVRYELPADSPLVDAVPPGANGCGSAVVDDVLGDPRPVDGDGDGVAGCDVGARERRAGA